MFGRDPITEAYLLRDDPYWRQKWEELRDKYEQSLGNSKPDRICGVGAQTAKPTLGSGDGAVAGTRMGAL